MTTRFAKWSLRHGISTVFSATHSRRICIKELGSGIRIRINCALARAAEVMTFLGSPCPCGWSLDEELDAAKNCVIARVCSRCHRRYVKHSWGWEQITPKNQLETPKTCPHNRLWTDFGVNKDSCPHCEAAAVRHVMES